MKIFTLSLALASGLLLGACASTHPTPVFQAPSVAPVKHAVEQTKTHVSAAKGAAQKLADECAQKNAGWQAAYDQLMQELNDAYVAASTAQSLAEELQKQNDAMADVCNKVSADKMKAETQRDSVIAKYHRVKFYGTIETGLIFLVIGGFLGMHFLPFGYGLLGFLAGPLAALAYELLL